MWILFNKRVSTRWYPGQSQTLLQRLVCVINVILKGGSRRKTEEAGEAIEKLLGADLPVHNEAWHQMKRCYKAAVDRTPPPTQVTLERITAERVDLYCQVQPPREKIPISVKPFQVEDLGPTEDEIEWSVRCLHNNRSGSPLGLRVDHHKRWLKEEWKSEAAVEKAAVEAVEATGGPG